MVGLGCAILALGITSLVARARGRLYNSGVMHRAALSYVWAMIVALAVFAYIVMDGFDLGIGILFPLFHGERERGTVMNTIAPVWDGNETWLILGGGGLMAAFPLAYAILMPALYTPVIAMLLGL